MNCSWKEEQAHRFAEGTMESQALQAFADHLPNCTICQERVAEARRVENLLRTGITPVPAPVTLASRVANAVAAEREQARQLKPSFWSRLRERRILSPVLAGLALVLALSAVSYAVAPEAVTALARRVLFFVPGLGIEPVSEATLVANQPASVQVAGATFSVEALISDGQSTQVKFRISGLPGGKGGWDAANPREHEPVLRLAAGDEYAVTSMHTAYGGTPEETVLQGGMTFPALPAGERTVELIVPVEFLVPPAILPEGAGQTWVVPVSLVHPDMSDLPSATPQNAAATAQGITLRVAASTVEADRTVVLLEGQAGSQGRLSDLGKMGGNPADVASLRDDRGREYRLMPTGSSVTHVRETLSTDLYFEPLARGASTLTLHVPVVRLWVEGEAKVTIPLAGREWGDKFALDRTVELAGYPVQLKTAELVRDRAVRSPTSDEAPPVQAGTSEDGELWLYVEVDLGESANGHTLSSFQIEQLGGSSGMQSFGDDNQLALFGVPVEPGATEVTIRLHTPVIAVEGPWEMTFPIGSN